MERSARRALPIARFDGGMKRPYERLEIVVLIGNRGQGVCGVERSAWRIARHRVLEIEPRRVALAIPQPKMAPPEASEIREVCSVGCDGLPVRLLGALPVSALIKPSAEQERCMRGMLDMGAAGDT